MLRGLLGEFFPGIPGGEVSHLKAAEAFQNNQPARIQSLGRFQIREDNEDAYGMRISGYLKPPRTGDYVFYLSSDDEGELYISEDESEDKFQLIAFVKRGPSGIGNESGRTPFGEWGKNPTTISKRIYLEAGQRYSIKALLKQSMMNPHLAVTWQMPGDPPPRKNAPP